LTSIALRGTYLDDEDVAGLLRLSLPGIDEVVGLLAISKLASSGYDEVVVDTAPTGHTLRMLAAPALLERVAALLDGLQAHHREVVQALRGRYVADEADGLIAELERDGASLAATLRDRTKTRLSWVTIAEPMALEETSDAVQSLERGGLHVSTLIVNRITLPPPQPCNWCEARRRFEARALGPLQRRFPNVDILALPEFLEEPRGIAALEKVGRSFGPRKAGATATRVARRTFAQIGDAVSVRPASALPGTGRWLLFGGKGGVGKSTCAAAFAIDLAASEPARRVLLLSSDPAHSLGDVFGVPLDNRPRPIDGAPGNLHVREIDASLGLEQFRQQYLDSVDAVFARISRGSGVAADGPTFRQLVDLAPPGIDEVIAIADVAEALTGPDRRYDTIVSDTAPTGHALRLLQTPHVLREWTQALMAILLKYREIVASGPLAAVLVRLSKRLRTLDALLRDPRQTAFVIVTRPAALPREESLRLHSTLTDLGIATRAVIVNAIGAGTCSRCRKQIRGQTAEIGRLGRALRGTSYAIIGTPAVVPPPHGVEALSAWASGWRRLD